jgi:hypothetical protein
MPEKLPKETKEPVKEETGKEMRNFTIVQKDGTEGGVFKGRQPRQAALKAANTMGGTKSAPIEFDLREKGTKKLHTFIGYTEMVKAPENRPKWMKEMVCKPFVKKVGTDKIEKTKKTEEKPAAPVK